MKVPLSFKILRATLRPVSYVAPSLTASYWAGFFMQTDRHRRPGWEQELLKTGESLTLAGNIRAWSFGQGPTVVLAHGWDGRGSQLGKFVGPLVQAGFRVVAYDAPAHGDSPGTWTNIVLNSRAMVAITDDLKDRYGPIHGVIAHSFGGASSALAVSMGMEVRKLVMIATPCSMQNVFDRFTQFVEMSPKARTKMQLLIEEAAGFKAQSLEVDRLAERMTGVQGLIFHDPQDDEVPFAEAECIARTWKTSRLVAVENVGHRKILKHGPVIQDAVQFLAVS